VAIKWQLKWQPLSKSTWSELMMAVRYENLPQLNVGYANFIHSQLLHCQFTVNYF